MSVLPLVLASSSPYRRELLRRLGLEFEAANPELDERPRPGESPLALVQRLAAGKAAALSKRFSQHLIIGSDQVASCEGRLLAKPGNSENAREQLRWQSGREVAFLTGLCLLNSATGEKQVAVVPTRVRFRVLNEAEITRYVDRESPFDCAGSFKCEGLGISLFEAIDSDDPTALIGLPLIRLCDMLRRESYKIP